MLDGPMIFVILLISERAAKRVMGGTIRYLEEELSLPVNREKSQVAKVKDVPFVGLQILRGKIRVSDKVRRRFKDRVRELTRRNNALSMCQAIENLNEYLRGWIGYFRIQEFRKLFGDMDTWIRNRLRSMQLKKWKKPRKFQRMMIQAGQKTPRSPQDLGRDEQMAIAYPQRESQHDDYHGDALQEQDPRGDHAGDRARFPSDRELSQHDRGTAERDREPDGEYGRQRHPTCQAECESSDQRRRDEDLSASCKKQAASHPQRGFRREFQADHEKKQDQADFLQPGYVFLVDQPQTRRAEEDTREEESNDARRTQQAKNPCGQHSRAEYHHNLTHEQQILGHAAFRFQPDRRRISQATMRS
jgi:Group II intron, maturase-specific domain